MARISVDKNLMVELVDFKLRYLKGEVESILKKWKYDFSSEFLEDARNGKLEEAEEDAIMLKNLQDEINNLSDKKNKWISQ